jgi:hypothetical protein
MPIRLTDNLAYPNRGTVTQAMAYAVTQRADRQVFLHEYFTELYRLCAKYQLDFSILVAQSANETGKWKSAIWNQYGNPAGIGVTGSDVSSGPNESLVYENGKDAARAHVVHMQAYVRGAIPATTELHDYIEFDPRYEAVFEAGYDGTIRRIQDFNVNGRWALLTQPPPYGQRIVNDGLAVWPSLPNQSDPPVEVPTTPEEPVEEEPPMAELQFGRVPMFAFTDRQAQMRNKPEGVGWDNLGKRNPKFIALHRIWGNLWGTDGYFANPSVQALTDFGVGVAAEDGAANAGLILKWTDPLGYRSGWASGRVSAPYGDGKKIVDKYGVSAVNRDGVSLEISGFENTPIDDKAWKQIVHFCAWWADFMKIPWNSQINPATGINYLIWHQEFTIGTGKQCPFVLVMSLTDKLYADVAAFLKPYQTGSVGEPQPEQPTEPVPAPTYAPPLPIEALVPFADVDPNQTDAVILTGGKEYVFVNDKVRAIRETRRRQTAEADALDIGPVIPKGSEFEVTWLFQAGDGESYYLTPWHSRIRVADTKRIADAA